MSDCYTWAFFMAGIVTQVAGLVPLVLFCLEKKKGYDLTKGTGHAPVTIYRENNKCKLVKVHNHVLTD